MEMRKQRLAGNFQAKIKENKIRENKIKEDKIKEDKIKEDKVVEVAEENPGEPVFAAATA